MEAVQESPVALTALFGIILVSAQIFEAYALFNPVSVAPISRLAELKKTPSACAQ